MDDQQIAQQSFHDMVAYLENLLIRQIERVRQYDLDTALVLGEESHKLSMVISENKILDQPQFADEKFRLNRLYDDLGLIISTERKEVAEKLRQIREGIRALTAYKNG